MNMNLGGSGQTIVDRLNAARHSIAGQGLAKAVCKATTEEVLGPKKKHLGYLLACTNEPNVSIPQMANLLIERTQNSSWVVVFKGLITNHHLMCYGNERFTQYLASSNCSFQLGSFVDKTAGGPGFDMSPYIRRYAKYLNEKALSYRTVAFDFCKAKRGADGTMRAMSAEKLLKTLPVLQAQLDALLEFDCPANELTNGVINSAFMLLFRDLIRLFATYNDGIINLLEKYFDMNKKQCREALDAYKKFLTRMDKISEFLKVAEKVGVERSDIPDLSKAPSSLLDAMEQHLAHLEGRTYVPPSGYTATSGGAAAGSSSLDEVTRMKLLAEEEEYLNKLKEKHSKTNPFLASPVKEAAPSTQQAAASAPVAATQAQPKPAAKQQNIMDLLDSAPPPMQAPAPAIAPAKPANDLLQLGGNPFADFLSGPANSTPVPPVPPVGGVPVYPAQPGGGGMWGMATTTAPQPGMMGPMFSNATTTGQFSSQPDFAAAFGSTGGSSANGSFDAFGNVLQPTSTVAVAGVSPQRTVTPQQPAGSIFASGNIDSAIASLAENLTIQPQSTSAPKGGVNWNASPAKTAVGK